MDAVWKLGEKIRGDLGVGDDFLGRWMAQYLAESFVEAEALEGEAAVSKRVEIRDVIIQLWAHRAGMPIWPVPLESFRPVYVALARLSEPQSPWAFYRPLQGGEPPTADDDGRTALLSLALGIEDQVRAIIRGLIVEAARAAETREAPWVELALALGDDEADTIGALRRLGSSGPRRPGLAESETPVSMVNELASSAENLAALLTEVAVALRSANEADGISGE